MKVLVVLALAVFTGCNASIVLQNQPKAQLDMVKDAFWDYVSKSTLTAEDTLQMIKQSELGQEINTRICESADALTQYTLALRSAQVVPLTQELLTKLSQEAEQLKARLEQDLSTMTSQLQPYAEELNVAIQKQMEELRRDVTPLAEALDSEALRTTLLQKSEELKGSLDKSVKDLQARLGPYSEELKQKMDQNLEEFQKSIVPLTQSFQTHLTQRGQEIQQNLAPYGDELKKLDPYAQDLKAQLAALWESFTSKSQS